jgi:lysylphosphatidylglycerol synthetase-like protein (DUF2156 family)
VTLPGIRWPPGGEIDMLLLVVAALVVLLLFGFGFAIHLLWWIAIIALILWVIGFFMSRR